LEAFRFPERFPIKSVPSRCYSQSLHLLLQIPRLSLAYSCVGK